MANHTEPTADEFECPGCGRLIISLPAREPPPTRCAICAWLEEFVPDPETREKIRARMG
jgi:hypothetical protein